MQGRAFERRNLRLPFTLEQALERMESCAELERYMGQRFVTGYVAVKRVENENFKK